MRLGRIAVSVVVLLIMLGSELVGQAPRRSVAEINAAKNDFDYLIGDWEFTVSNKVYGDARGYWGVVSLHDGAQIVDQFRIVNEKGETTFSTTTLRSFNRVRGQWEYVSTDFGSGLRKTGVCHRIGSEMHIDQRAESPNRTRLRIRYYNIQPDRFTWTADRSEDDGKTWQKDYQIIEARRVGPARSLGRIPTAG